MPDDEEGGYSTHASGGAIDVPYPIDANKITSGSIIRGSSLRAMVASGEIVFRPGSRITASPCALCGTVGINSSSSARCGNCAAAAPFISDWTGVPDDELVFADALEWAEVFVEAEGAESDDERKLAKTYMLMRRHGHAK